MASIIILKYFSFPGEYGQENVGVEAWRFSSRVKKNCGRRCAIASEPSSFDTIVEVSGLELRTVYSILLHLELLGLVSMRQGLKTPILLSESRVYRNV
ncbi:DprA-like winged helix domain-containing protein [Microcoleus sp. Pol12B4]|uniref:DprA-like winged helix domain-containing protein n=1 Tax=Microcoleus sp. Pol12B4 TaxID=3055395 RepID=UPI002FD79584